MKSVIISILLGILSVSPAASQSRVFGQDTLALQHKDFDSAKFIQHLSHGSAAGALINTFGTEISPFTRILGSGKLKYLRIHLINGSCIANQNCGPYEIGYRYNLKTFEAALLKKEPKIVNYLASNTRAFCELQRAYPATKILISPVVEHRLGAAAYRVAADIIFRACPIIQLVNNPVTGKGEKYRGSWMESHSTAVVGADIYSFDGVDATDSDIRKWVDSTSRAKIAYVWSRVYNCRHQGNWEDPRRRTACPRERDFELLSHLTDSRPARPSGIPGCQSFKAPNTWKPLSEDKGTGDPRANLPVLLANLGKGNTQIFASNGNPIGVLRVFAPTTSTGLGRYYSGLPGALNLSGYEIEKKAVKVSGSPWVYAKQGSRCVGPYIPGMRQGSYR